MDAISDYFDSRARRSEGGGDGGGLAFTRSLRRTLPFQLVPQPPLAYARSNSYVGSVRSRALHHPRMVSHTEEQVQRNYKPSREASASEILSMLEKLTNSREGKRRMRYGLF